MMAWFYRVVCVMLVSVVISGCGYQLRGKQEIPEAAKTVTLSLTKGMPERFEQAMLKTLDEKKITVAGGAPYQLVIRDAVINRRSITLDSKANVDEYELLILVNFEIFDREGRSVSGPLVARNERIYDYNANAAAASFVLEKQIRVEMWKSVSENILRQFIARIR
jgi:LPS-assembly lipoprotein